MKNRWKRLVSVSLALVLAGSSALPALGADAPETPVGEGGEAELLDVTAGTYSPNITVQPGALYTLIALPYASNPPEVLTAADLVGASGSALFIGSATADAQGKLTFEDVRLRTAQAAVYYVTGLGLEDAPYREATGISTSAEGYVRTAGSDASATVTLVDKETDYHYNTGVQADKTGYFSAGHLAPGKYKLQVEKPGYLPYSSASETDYLDVTSGESVSQDVDISDYVGDVNNDGVRDMTDLAALLTYYGRSDAPQGVTADLDYSGTVDAEDAALLAAHLDTGTQTDVAGVSITVQDSGGANAASLRCLSFELDAAATVSAAAFSLTFQRDAVQPLTPEGGLMAPVDGGTLASCLVEADGFTPCLTSWKIDEDLITLSFAVTADTPQAAGQVARFYYRPTSGSTESFYHGVFELTHAAALVGKDTVVTQYTLTYPNFDAILLDAITIDQASTSDGEQPSLLIPAAGETAVLPLSATGHSAGVLYSDLPGVTWSVTRTDGGSLDGVTVTQSLLSVTSSAAVGELEITASRDGITSDPLKVTLKETPRVAASIQIMKDEQVLDSDTVVAQNYWDIPQLQYTALVYDQYGEVLDDQPQVTWSLLGAPADFIVEDGLVYCSSESILLSGQWVISVIAEAAGVQAVMSLDLTLSPEVRDYAVAGPTYITIPDEGEDPITYRYVIVGLDLMGGVRELDSNQVPYFGTVGEEYPRGMDVSQQMDGSYNVTVYSDCDPGVYFCEVGKPDGQSDYSITVSPRPEGSDASRAAIFYDGEAVEIVRISAPAGQKTAFSFTAKMLDRDGAVASYQPQEWDWSKEILSPTGATAFYDESSDIVVGENLQPGRYSGWISVQSPEIYRSDTLQIISLTYVPVILDVVPTLDKLDLSGPGELTIPTAKDLNYTLLVTGEDANGNHADLPSDLVWTVTSKDGSAAPAGVSVKDGVLTVTPDAVPGTVTVTVSDQDQTVAASVDMTLIFSGTDRVVTLYRQINIDGKTVQASSRVPASGDVIQIREGQTAVVTYTAMLVDQSTGEAVSILDDKVKWMGCGSTFTVDAKAQSGSYSATSIAVYGDQSATAAVQVSVYPDITDLRLDFGEGYDLDPPYTLAIPSGASKTYAATVIATVLRDGTEVQVPISELGLDDYELDVVCRYTGVYITLDKAAGALRFTVDPVAIQNSMDPPTQGSGDIRVLELTLSYFPGESLELDPFPFFLEKEESVVQDALLRRGVGSCTSFVFDTAKSPDTISIPAGSLSNCYALELLDQYKRPITDQGDVTWTLEGAPKDSEGSFLITMAQAGQVVERAYSNYASIRRLRINAATPTGTYPLVLSASCGAFTRSVNIDLEVTQADLQVDSAVISAGGELTIPRYYYYYNATTPNDAVNTFPFTFSMLAEDGRELDPRSCVITWSVTDFEGNAPTGVSVAAVSANTAAAAANVSADRTAQPTDADTPLQVTATAKTADGTFLGSATAPLALVRGASYPTVMEIRRNGQALSRDNITVASTDSITRDYTFYLWDQYGQPAPLSSWQKVQWSISNTTGTGISAKIQLDSSNIPSVRVLIDNPSKSVTANLTAAITFDEPNSETGKQTVYATIPLNLTVNTQSSGSSTGSSGSSGGTGQDSTATAGAPASLTISGGTALSATQGAAATRTFTATLRDSSGLTCSLSYDSQVTWSASGLTGGLTFDTATHVLTVPAAAALGTYTVNITAAYSTSVRQTIQVTVTVKAKDDTTAATDVTLTPTVTQTGTSGSAALTTAQEQALLATGVSGGTVTIVPTGGSGLTSLSVTLTSDTAGAIASQRGQSLRVQTALGTVVLSPESLRALAARGGSNVTVTLSSTSGGLKVDFSCGSSAASLPGSIVLNAFGSGNVALKVDSGGSETLLRKALVEEGKIYAYLTGSTQLKVETRSPSFADTQGHWAQSSISFTAARELFQGTSATTFDPGGNMTRSMVVTVLHRLEDTPAATSAATFSDVAQNSWYTSAIAWANAGGIVKGTGDGFKPNDPVTREQLATIFYNYVKSLGLSTDRQDSLAGFSDQSQVSAWAREAMEWAVGTGLINGKTGGLLDPGGYASRAEVSTILERLIRSMAPVV